MGIFFPVGKVQPSARAERTDHNDNRATSGSRVFPVRVTRFIPHRYIRWFYLGCHSAPHSVIILDPFLAIWPGRPGTVLSIFGIWWRAPNQIPYDHSLFSGTFRLPRSVPLNTEGGYNTIFQKQNSLDNNSATSQMHMNVVLYLLLRKNYSKEP